MGPLLDRFQCCTLSGVFVIALATLALTGLTNFGPILDIIVWSKGDILLAINMSEYRQSLLWFIIKY